MELVGDGVRLVGENELVSSEGSAAARRPRRRTEPATRSSTRLPRCTRSWPSGRRSIAELRNCIDMAVAAAFIQHQDYYGAVKWDAGTCPR